MRVVRTYFLASVRRITAGPAVESKRTGPSVSVSVSVSECSGVNHSLVQITVTGQGSDDRQRAISLAPGNDDR